MGYGDKLKAKPTVIRITGLAVGAHYWFSGGRNSTKSSFISIAIVLLILLDRDSNAIIFRKVKDTLKTSVYEQILWACNILGVSSYFRTTLSPLEITYLPTGQRILFRGMDDPAKTKSIKLHKGAFKVIWFEEADEFSGSGLCEALD